MSTHEDLKHRLGLADSELVRPLPQPTPWSRPFWEAACAGRFVLKHCLDCGHIDHPPYLYCTSCGSERAEWRPASGRATLTAFAVNTYGVPAPFLEDLPYVLAIVELPEGPRMISNIVDCPHERLRNGMRLEVVFEPAGEGTVLPKWRPVTGAEDTDA